MDSHTPALSDDIASKRDAVLDHAVQVFAAEGYRNTDVQVIADRAGVGKGTVYRYFNTKQDLFWATADRLLRALESDLTKAMEGIDSVLEQLRAAGLAYARFYDEHPEYIEIAVQERAEFRGSAPQSHVDHHEEMIGRFAEIIQAGIDAGELRPVDVRKTIVSYGALLYGTVVFACYANVQHPLKEMAQHAVEIFLDGMRAKRATENRGSPQ